MNGQIQQRFPFVIVSGFWCDFKETFPEMVVEILGIFLGIYTAVFLFWSEVEPCRLPLSQDFFIQHFPLLSFFLEYYYYQLIT